MIALEPAPAALLARPIAHRGLHDRGAGVIENSLAAARAAVARGYAIECDVQASADGEAMTFHDFTLERLAEGEGPVRALAAARLAAIPLKGVATPETIPTLADLLSAVAGRVPLVVEVKSRFDGDLALARRVVALLAEYGGPVAVKSFDPAVVAGVRALAPGLVRGIVAEAAYDHPEWEALEPSTKRRLAALSHLEETRPHFLSWHAGDLPHAAPHLARALGGLPVMTWTIRSAAAAAAARPHVDQIVFEGFDPG